MHFKGKLDYVEQLNKNGEENSFLQKCLGTKYLIKTNILGNTFRNSKVHMD